jgi:hypothetical protein
VVSFTKYYIIIIYNNYFIIILALSGNCLFPLEELPKDFLLSVYKCSKYFSELQIQVIENNIKCFLQKTTNYIKSLTELQYCVAKTYVDKFQIKPIDRSQKIVGLNKLQV